MLVEGFEVISLTKTESGIDSKIVGSLVLFGLEDNSVNEAVFEKLVQRALHLKSEE
jgi:hypothetical protein